VKAPEPRPRWDAGLRELWLGEVLVKRYRHDAVVQRCILDAFQKHGWRGRIEDPLPVVRGRNRKMRLHDAIQSLNRGQARRRIWFRGDGSASGTRWEIVR
jgi:hypothetical protein